MSTYETKLIETAREFPRLACWKVAYIARIRAERAERAPVEAGNNYTRVFSHFGNDGQPVFIWQNWGGV